LISTFWYIELQGWRSDDSWFWQWWNDQRFTTLLLTIGHLHNMLIYEINGVTFSPLNKATYSQDDCWGANTTPSFPVQNPAGTLSWKWSGIFTILIGAASGPSVTHVWLGYRYSVSSIRMKSFADLCRYGGWQCWDNSSTSLWASFPSWSFLNLCCQRQIGLKKKVHRDSSHSQWCPGKFWINDSPFLTALTMDQIGTMIFARSIFPKSITEVALTIVD